MASMNTSQFQDVVEPILNTVYDGVYDGYPAEWSQAFSVEDAKKRSFEEKVILYGLGLAVVKGQGAPITYDEGGEAYRVPFVHLTYALAFSLTQELIEDGEHISIGKIYTRQLAKSMLETKEIVHANILNRAENASYTYGDGQPLYSTAHPYSLGGTWSNTITNGADLSESALEQIFININRAKDQRGVVSAMLKPRKLIIAPENEFEAARILRSVLRVGTGNNDVNAIKALNRIDPDPLIMRRITVTGFWGVKTDIEEGLVHMKRVGLDNAMEGAFETGNMRYKARERYSASVVDPRVLWGSLGS